MTAGSSYWGVQDMAGNLWEPVVNANYGTGGINYTGVHGDGNLNINGFSDIPSWPGYTSSFQIDGYQGAGIKGGAFSHNNTHLQTSNRNSVASSSINQRNNDNGGRGIRTAP
jgi:formylglycine-generating enzyme required for sulfatase activity